MEGEGEVEEDQVHIELSPRSHFAGKRIRVRPFLHPDSFSDL